jgi:toxin HigB-1
MIVSFANKETEKIWLGTLSRRLPVGIQQKARLKLRMLHAAARLDDLRAPPANRLEALARDRKGCHSIRINDQWRICFRWNAGQVSEMEIVDYH